MGAAKEIYYETSVDLGALDLLAARAAKNKSGKAVDGPLTVRVTYRSGRIGPESEENARALGPQAVAALRGFRAGLD